MAPRTYEIRVNGHIPPDELIEIENLTAETEPAQTVLRGYIPDQAALHGIIRRFNALGLELIEVRQLPQGTPRRLEQGQ